MSPPDPSILARAAELLRAGGLVALPTETVYGLAANALDAAAVDRIFRVKGRPASSPLIVHVASVEMARSLAAAWPEAAERLAARFWPGPLTLVVRKNPIIPANVTAGLDTVGLRWPAHPVIEEVIRLAGVPLAAPSANRFTELSPTTAEHVIASLGEAVDLVVDGGPCAVGIESTVLSVAGEAPLLLRPGMISQDDLEEELGSPIAAAGRVEGAHPSPGMHQRHYAPRTPLLLLRTGDPLPPGRVAHLWLMQPEDGAACSLQMPAEAAEYAATLYETLHTLDRESFDWIAVELPPNWPEWAAIHDRLRRAAG